MYWLHSYACIICLYIFYCWDLFLWMIWAAEQQWNGPERDCYFAQCLQKISKFCILTFIDCFIASSPPPLTFTATLRSEKLSAIWNCKKYYFDANVQLLFAHIVRQIKVLKAILIDLSHVHCVRCHMAWKMALRLPILQGAPIKSNDAKQLVHGDNLALYLLSGQL